MIGKIPWEELDMRILIVEDESRLAETLRQLMEDQRYQADTVGTGQTALNTGSPGSTTSLSWT